MAREFMLEPAAPEPRRPGRRKQYHPVLEQLIKNGEQEVWYLVARYDATTGARDAAKNMRNGKIKIPRGNWRIKSQVFDEPDDDGKQSGLYMMWMGEE